MRFRLLMLVPARRCFVERMTPSEKWHGRNPLFGQLPLELSDNLRSINPWWSGDPAPPLPDFRRWPFERLIHLLAAGMAPATVLRAPRRVGKTVLLKQIIEILLRTGTSARHILYVPFDELPTLAGIREPVLTIARWFEKEILSQTFNNAARQSEPALLFLDEVQNLACDSTRPAPGNARTKAG